jgi:hypothetical protein
MKPNPEKWRAYVHSLKELHRDVSNGNISNDEAKAKLESLKKMETEMGVVMEPTRIRKRKPRATRPQIIHALDFKCQCKRCVRLYTITLEDKNWLKEMGIIWNKTEEAVPTTK